MADVSALALQHDIEEFFKVVQRYGLWKADIRKAGEVFGHQLRLLGDEAAS